MEDTQLIRRAQTGDQSAFDELLQPMRQSLFSYIYRMVTHREDAEDLLQEVLLRVLNGLPKFRGEAKFKTWLFGIATHVCLDHLRQRHRWRVEAQLIGEQETDSSSEELDQLTALMSEPDFVYEIREHIAFCFSCISRTLPPEEQAALMLREVLGFTGQEAAKILEISEPVLRHRLSAARATMIRSYEGLCQLINKTGICHQCQGLRELAPPENRGANLVQIEIAPGNAFTPENLFDARLQIVREAELANGKTRLMHDAFFADLSVREETHAGSQHC
ncbi:MAG TPA: RNA polymerase sigma factor [Blastocatellia bacterium]|nr:RNA polymerase sigma factor [Blastocatellia bacterium]HMV83311.1 RNA polymerase sigma factor [Blastocatellia bacterium]HMX24211.1 RNA polymerase sigma factor [Blastocatellia bacterium]HMY71832.1 RNA polymerase sigma factor [Blastocatellia bacterium]HMZ16592.1 RNA polymerase sigma factor [Blastocatellia bacterium]